MSAVQKSHKFALIAFQNASITPLPTPLNFAYGMSVYSGLPFSLPTHWERWLGTLKSGALQESNLILLVTAPSEAPKVLDQENRALERKVTAFLYALLMGGVPHLEEGMLLSGANDKGDLRVRSVTQLDHYLRPAHVPPKTITIEDLTHGDRVAGSLLRVLDQSGGFKRLRRGVAAWRRGIIEERPQDRLHQFVRSLEALIMPDIGKTKAQFTHRTQLLAKGKNLRAVLQQLFDI